MLLFAGDKESFAPAAHVFAQVPRVESARHGSATDAHGRPVAVGDRVNANWLGGGTLYTGRVVAIYELESAPGRVLFDVDYDDGALAWWRCRHQIPGLRLTWAPTRLAAVPPLLFNRLQATRRRACPPAASLPCFDAAHCCRAGMAATPLARVGSPP